ncbi:MAG: AlpA family phage regulatory protein [Magnetococcales bacterium]|nr:AlpA family phage regulatory protein [Magnetococcales bacterium]
MEEQQTKTKPVLIGIKKVMTMTDMSKSGIYKLMTLGQFPKQRQMKGSRRVFWYEHEVLDWIKAVEEVPGW